MTVQEGDAQFHEAEFHRFADYLAEIILNYGPSINMLQIFLRVFKRYT